ncbi:MULTISPECIES: EutN/CcmL family microcompartment protein [unclassified Lysinibacillus]|uniref:EutN/CcmL family microcompartment protein n=1 Tax=unclassified Lysinibacillus TaxID=2636778 RepID=UPI0020137862|nr:MULTISPECIES: EutN/CcmL family microcompartment protein [unclassified Lysinibacillus]MCL1695072.1 EutN/CcmL family microcompartment protein [Lysinibacillus sp. BPa_S21]MCL1701259.1 EutN/CcmL family microcompartment protein [Lysinibacillus sp. Bpr_S20]
MLIAKVVGSVWATQKEKGMENIKLLIVQPINLSKEPVGNSLVAMDRIGAGFDEMVLIAQGSLVQKLVADKNSPIDAAIVGIIDSFEGE